MHRWWNLVLFYNNNKLCGKPPQYASAPVTFTFDIIDLESGVRVTCYVGYLGANFSLPRPIGYFSVLHKLYIIKINLCIIKCQIVYL